MVFCLAFGDYFLLALPSKATGSFSGSSSTSLFSHSLLLYILYKNRERESERVKEKKWEKSSL